MSQLTATMPTGVTGYQFNCNKTAACTHTAVGSGGWHTILCVWSHSIPLSGNGISCFMHLYKAVCILIHPRLPLYLSPSLFLPSLSVSFPPFPHRWVLPLPPRHWYSGYVLCAGCGGVLGSGGEWEGAVSSKVQVASVISVYNALCIYISIYCSVNSPLSGIPFVSSWYGYID